MKQAWLTPPFISIWHVFETHPDLWQSLIPDDGAYSYTVHLATASSMIYEHCLHFSLFAYGMLASSFRNCSYYYMAKLFALYRSGFWYCAAVYCSLCLLCLIGTSLDFVVVYRSHCNFVGRRENHTIWFSLHQFLLKFLFLVCDLFCLHPCVFHFISRPPCHTLACISCAAYSLSSSLLAHHLCLPAC